VLTHPSRAGGGGLAPENRFAAHCCSYTRPHSSGTKDDRYNNIYPARNTVYNIIYIESIIIIIINGRAAGAGAATILLYMYSK